MRQTDASAQRSRLVLSALLVGCAITPLIWAVKLTITPKILFPDFFGLWSFGRYVLGHAPATIYDGGSLQAFETGFGLPAVRPYEFYYPPWILLILAPVGALPYAIARVVWLVVTFAAYAAALTAWRWPRPAMGMLLLAPSSAVCFLVGQNGFLTAALMLGGMRLLPARPLIAGALLGALVCKPQLAILVPFFLLFGRHWRAMAGAALCVAGLSLAVTAGFGTGIWGAWLESLRGHSNELSGARDALRDMMPTVMSAVRLLGGGKIFAAIVQAGFVLAGLLAVWRVRARADSVAQAVLPLATILATPYAFDYDLPMVTGAVLAVIAGRIGAGGLFDQPAFVVLLACVAAPMVLPARLGAIAAVVPVIYAWGLWVMCRTNAADRDDRRNRSARG
jgi:hypothetical protein